MSRSRFSRESFSLDSCSRACACFISSHAVEISGPQPLAILPKERLQRREHFGDPLRVRPEIGIPAPETQWASIVALQAVDFGLEVARVISTALFPRLFVPRYTRTDPHSLV